MNEVRFGEVGQIAPRCGMMRCTAGVDMARQGVVFHTFITVNAHSLAMLLSLFLYMKAIIITMDKKFCNNCNREIDTSTGYFKLETARTERDFGLPLSYKTADLCSRKCLTEYAETLRRATVTKETITEKGKTVVRYTWEGNVIAKEDVEQKNNRYCLAEKAYEKYRK